MPGWMARCSHRAFRPAPRHTHASGALQTARTGAQPSHHAFMAHECQRCMHGWMDMRPLECRDACMRPLECRDACMRHAVALMQIRHHSIGQLRSATFAASLPMTNEAAALSSSESIQRLHVGPSLDALRLVHPATFMYIRSLATPHVPDHTQVDASM